MIEPEFIELMNQEVDGANTPEESSRLRRHLDAHPEARAYFEDLCEMGRMFRDAGDVEPPCPVSEAVMASLPGRPRPKGGRWRSLRFVAAARTRMSPKLAFAFSAGLVTGMFLLAVALLIAQPRGPGGPVLDPARLTGTLVAWEPPGEVLASECLELNSPRTAGTSCIEYSSGVIRADITLASERDVRIVFRHGDQIRFDSYRSPGGGEHALTVRRDRVELLHRGTGEYALLFRDLSGGRAPMDMFVEEGDEVLVERTIRPRQ